MAQTYTFPGGDTLPRRRSQRAKRPTGNKLQEIAARSPQDMRDIDRIADMVLARLNEENIWGDWTRRL